MHWKRLLPIAIGALLAVAAPASAETFDVTTTLDDAGACPAVGTAQCTLRAAVLATKANGIDVPDVINVPAGTYLLTAGELDFGTTNQLLTLRGAGADATTIRSDGSSRAIYVGGESSVAIERVTIAGGSVSGEEYGGNIAASYAELKLDQVRVTGGGADGGGGIYSTGSLLDVTHSLIDDNQATSDGGGILTVNGGALEVADSTITGNSAPLGGGISARDTEDPQAFARFTRVTLAGNTATASEGGGLAVAMGNPAPRIAGSIVADNLGQVTRSGPLSPSNCTSDVLPTDGGGNLESGTDCAFVRTDSLQTPDTGLAAALAPAGGTLPVLAIAADSPARELAGACIGTDQRGVARPQGALCDAGAFEYVAPAAQPPVPTPTAIPTPTPTAAPAATPVAGQSVGAKRVSGKVLVKLPGSKKFVALDPSVIKNGAELDTRNGIVEITRSDGGVGQVLRRHLQAQPIRRDHHAHADPEAHRLPEGQVRQRRGRQEAQDAQALG